MINQRNTQYHTEALQQNLLIRFLRMSDCLAIRRWMADIDLVRYTVVVPEPKYATNIPYSLEDADRYLVGMLNAPDRVTFAIECNGIHIGNMGLKEIKPESRVSECFIEICDPSLRRQGIATWAMTRLLDYALFEREFIEVTLGVMEFNRPAIGLYQRLGFQSCGDYGCHWADGQFWRVLKMKIGQTEWACTREAISRAFCTGGTGAPREHNIAAMGLYQPRPKRTALQTPPS
jgi:RimJ/RimL family protein N-acetyltransferase